MDSNFENKYDLKYEDNFRNEDKNKYFGRRVAITGGIILGYLLWILNIAVAKTSDLFDFVYIIVGGTICLILAHYLDCIRKKGNKVVVPVVNIVLIVSYILAFCLIFIV